MSHPGWAFIFLNATYLLRPFVHARRSKVFGDAPRELLQLRRPRVRSPLRDSTMCYDTDMGKRNNTPEDAEVAVYCQ